jgi:hypothetical protein
LLKKIGTLAVLGLMTLAMGGCGKFIETQTNSISAQVGSVGRSISDPVGHPPLAMVYAQPRAVSASVPRFSPPPEVPVDANIDQWVGYTPAQASDAAFAAAVRDRKNPYGMALIARLEARAAYLRTTKWCREEVESLMVLAVVGPQDFSNTVLGCVVRSSGVVTKADGETPQSQYGYRCWDGGGPGPACSKVRVATTDGSVMYRVIDRDDLRMINDMIKDAEVNYCKVLGTEPRRATVAGTVTEAKPYGDKARICLHRR